MQMPLEIQFRNVSASEAVEAAVRKRVAKLEQLNDALISCRVTIEAPHRHHRQGNLYTVSVDLRQAGGETLANRAPQASHEHEDVYVALRDAFQAARRQVLKRVRTQRGDVKHHTATARDALAIDGDVLVDEEAVEERPQARSVYLAGKRHASG